MNGHEDTAILNECALPGPESARTEGKLFLKDTIIDGKPAKIECFQQHGQTYVRSGKWLKYARLEDEWFEDVHDPSALIDTLKHSQIKADMFTFWQRIPDTEPQYDYYKKYVDLAAIPVHSYEQWWSQGISASVRKKIRKSAKSGVEVREVPFDDSFVRGMVGIFNENPIRQGRPFFHYGKDFETVKHQFSRFIFREKMIGAYLNDELIGFIMLAIADQYARTIQFISYQKHRDKQTNNALIAKAVEICADKKLPYLCYGYWTDDSLSDFKSHCGFQRISVPRYYIPLNLKGQIALSLHLHDGIRGYLPAPVRHGLKTARKFWMQKRTS